MKEKIIKNYINKLTLNDIKTFSINNNIHLTNDEYEYLYKIIKEKWYIILYGNPNNIFNNLKNKLSIDKYNQVIQLYQTYKDKYSHYL